MASPRAYRLIGSPVLAEIVRRGFAAEFGALWGELQFRPTDGGLGVMRLRGAPVEFPDGFLVRVGGHWLSYSVDHAARTVTLLDLAPIL